MGNDCMRQERYCYPPFFWPFFFLFFFIFFASGISNNSFVEQGESESKPPEEPQRPRGSEGLEGREQEEACLALASVPDRVLYANRIFVPDSRQTRRRNSGGCCELLFW